MHASWKAFAVCAIVLLAGLPTAGKMPGSKATQKTTVTPGEGAPVLWRDPGDIAGRNTYYGPGGKAHEPHGVFTFDKEDPQGTSPKFDVIDQDGVHWRVKLGPEAQPEIVATRLVWAVGYFANEDYFMPVLHVQNMQHLHRGAKLVSADGTVRNVRLKRHSKDKKIGQWSWANCPFTKTREWYGLQVFMAAINNWDLKDANNSIYQFRGDPPEQRYVVSDLGASFGTSGLNWVSKGNLTAYQHSKWLGSTSHDEYVDFSVPSAPAADFFFNVPETVRRLGLLWLGRHIPRDDVRWMGHLLAQLSPEQIRDAFRAAGYSPAEVEGFTQVLTSRIHTLNQL
jgi:hypothetical protein